MSELHLARYILLLLLLVLVTYLIFANLSEGK